MIFFSVIHFTGGLTQVVSAIGAGLFMSAIYICSKNILVPIIFHTIWNSAIFLIATPVETGQPLLIYSLSVMAETQSASIPSLLTSLIGALSFVLPTILFFIGLFLMRKSKHAEIKELWGIEETIEA